MNLLDDVKIFFWAVYDHLGGLLALNVHWAALVSPWLLVAFLLVRMAATLGRAYLLSGCLLAIEAVIYSPPTLLLFLAGRHWARGEDAPLRVLFVEWKRLAWKAQLLGWLVTAATMGLLINALFYRSVAGWVGVVLSGMMGGLVLPLLLTALYLLPDLVARRKGIWQTLGYSLQLALINLWASLGLLLISMILLTGGVLSGLGLFFGIPAALALLISVSYERMKVRSHGEPPAPNLQRHWREILHPWEV